MLAKALAAATASAAPVYVEDVFSTFLYTGNGSTQTITNGIALADGFSITPGTALAGGYFAGFISQTGNGVATHALIVAPAATGATGTGYTLTTNKQWKTANTTTAGTTSTYDGAANTAAMVTAGIANHPAAQFCTGLSIGGYTDWYLPAYLEMDIAYYNLKPTTDSNDTGYGINAYSVPARGSNYTAGTPAQTTVTAFKTGNSEAFVAGSYWSSTESSSTLAWYLHFSDGSQASIDKDLNRRVRAFRKIPVTDPLITAYAVTGEGGLVWIKNRGLDPSNNFLFDTLRGAGNYLRSNQSSAQGNFSPLFSSFNANGFSLNGSSSDLNSSSYTYCSWTFRKAAKFFDVVTFTTAPGSYSATVNHSLGSTPGCIIVKCTTTGGTDWNVWHRSLASDKGLWLQSTAAQNTQGTNWITANSTSFSANASLPLDNSTYVAYLFAHDAGGFGDAGTDNVVSCGSFTTDGSGVGTAVSLGWEPQWIIYKSTVGSSAWKIADAMRGIPTGGNDPLLSANNANAENTTSNEIDINATGFQLVGNGNLSDTYIYMAIRRGPMKTPTVGTEVFSAVTATASTGTSRTIGFPSDLIWARRRNAVNGPQAVDRLRGLATSSSSTTQPTFDMAVNTNAESTGGSPTVYDVWNDTAKDGSYFNGLSTIWHHFRRAPGFFDVVAYTGTGSNTQTVAHNLTVVPELLILKGRSAGSGDDMYWRTDVKNNDGKYSYFISTTGLSSNAAALLTDFPVNVNGTIATSAFFTPYSLTASSPYGGYTASQTYIAYLFATCPGVSKVGSYTGTGTTKQIDCGFTAGARFVLIKRTDSTGDWYTYDTARGIISGNDPFLLINSTAAENTSTDYIDPLSSGFEISSTAPAAINANGGSFIFLAIS